MILVDLWVNTKPKRRKAKVEEKRATFLVENYPHIYEYVEKGTAEEKANKELLAEKETERELLASEYNAMSKEDQETKEGKAMKTKVSKLTKEIESLSK